MDIGFMHRLLIYCVSSTDKIALWSNLMCSEVIGNLGEGISIELGVSVVHAAFDSTIIIFARSCNFLHGNIISVANTDAKVRLIVDIMHGRVVLFQNSDISIKLSMSLTLV
jgi:hypothetical protein